MDELVVRGAEQRMSGVLTVARAVHERLGMLDAQAHGERLRLDPDAAIVEHLEGVARAVADGEDDVIGRNRLAARKHDAAHAPVPGFDVDGPAPEPDFTAQRMYGLAQILHYGHQSESADVRSGRIQDFLGRAGLHELRKHLSSEVARIPHLAVELAVGKRAGAAFAELHVRLRVEHRSAPQSPRVLRALAHRLAALQDDRPEAHLREKEASEKPQGPVPITTGREARRSGALAGKR
jgi:hypothetical protein